MNRLREAQQAGLPAAVTDMAGHLAEAGYKVTRPRLAVLMAAHAQEGAFSVQELEQWLTRRGPSPGTASIFRTVRLLCDLNLMQRIHGLDDCHRYCIHQGQDHHLVCTQCGATEYFDNGGIQTLIAQLEARTGYHIREYLVELFGLCPRCRAAAGA